MYSASRWLGLRNRVNGLISGLSKSWFPGSRVLTNQAGLTCGCKLASLHAAEPQKVTKKAGGKNDSKDFCLGTSTFVCRCRACGPRRQERETHRLHNRQRLLWPLCK